MRTPVADPPPAGETRDREACLDNHETELVEALPGAAPLESVVESPGGLSLGSILGGATSAHAGPSAAAGNLRPDQVVALQRSAGNQSVSRLIAPGVPFAPFLGLDEPEREEDDGTGSGPRRRARQARHGDRRRHGRRGRRRDDRGRRGDHGRDRRRGIRDR